MRNVSERTVQRDWDKARVYLHQGLRACQDSAFDDLDRSDALEGAEVRTWMSARAV